LPHSIAKVLSEKLLGFVNTPLRIPADQYADQAVQPEPPVLGIVSRATKKVLTQVMTALQVKPEGMALDVRQPVAKVEAGALVLRHWQYAVSAVRNAVQPAVFWVREK